MTQARYPSLVGLRLRAFGAKPPSELASFMYTHRRMISYSKEKQDSPNISKSSGPTGSCHVDGICESGERIGRR